VIATLRPRSEACARRALVVRFGDGFAKGGHRCSSEAEAALRDTLLRCALLTPNLPEAECW